jgi:hypothetical protein
MGRSHKFGAILGITAALTMTVACQFGGKIELVGQSSNEETPLFGDYAVNVICTYRNTGSAKDVSVYATLDARSGGHWKKFASGAIGKDETRQFTLRFPEIDYQLLGDNAYTYACGLE